MVAEVRSLPPVQASLSGQGREHGRGPAGPASRASPPPSQPRPLATAGELDLAGQRQVAQLRRIDRQVRAHEQAHVAAAGPYARGGPHYQYQTGPDDRQYAVGGEVDVDTAPVPNDPEATIRKAEVVRRAALAPAQPSPQDQRVAAQASRLEARARQELRRESADGEGEAETSANQLPPPSIRPQEPSARDSGPLDLSESPEDEALLPGVNGGDSTGDRPPTLGQILDLFA